MNVLVDRHHAALFFWMQRLFEDRLGMRVYTPVGREWWDAGIWQFGVHVWGDDRLGRQFLGYDDRGIVDSWTPAETTVEECERHSKRCLACGHEWSGTSCGDEICGFLVGTVCGCDEFYVSVDGHYPQRTIRGVTLEQFRELGDWAFVVATVQDNQAGFRRLADETGAKYVLQVGNTGQRVDWDLDPLAIVTSEVPIAGRGVLVHQELAYFYRWRDPQLAVRDRVCSFVNCLPHSGYWPLVQQLAGALEGFDVRVHGIDGPQGNVQPQSAIADAMAQAGWGLHCKPGDGFGHVLFSWAAIGRPLVGFAEPYADKLGGRLWEDGVTSVNLDHRTPEEAAALIREISGDDARYGAMCAAIRARFAELVDYDAEELRIRELLGVELATS